MTSDADDEVVQRLIERTLAGDQRAFGQLYDLHVRVVARFVGRLLDIGADAEDVVQETFVQAYDGLQGYRGESRFRTWLLGIAYNLCRARWRERRRRFGTLDGGAEAAAATEPWDALVARERMRRLRKVLDDMPDTYRDAFSLCVLGGLSMKSCSELTGLPVNTVASHVFRARVFLRDQMTKAETGGRFDG